MLERIQHHVENREDGRFYVIEGQEYELESVTTNLHIVNKPDLTAWMVKHGREQSISLRDEAGMIGTMVHEAGLRLLNGEGYGEFEWSLLGHPTPDDERVRNAVAALVLMIREHKLSVAGAEWFVWSKEFGYAGTADLIAWTDESQTAVDIYDWKTSDRIYPTVWMQLAAYAIAFTECYDIPVRRIIPVRLERGPKVLPIIDGRPARKPHYELGDTIKVDGIPVRRPYKEGQAIEDSFNAYVHALELGKYIKAEGGRY